jgi:hypothetical protein
MDITTLKQHHVLPLLHLFKIGTIPLHKHRSTGDHDACVPRNPIATYARGQPWSPHQQRRTHAKSRATRTGDNAGPTLARPLRPNA